MKRQLDAPEWAAIRCAGKAERRGSRPASAGLDGVKKAGLWPDCALQGRRRCRLMPVRLRPAAPSLQCRLGRVEGAELCDAAACKASNAPRAP